MATEAPEANLRHLALLTSYDGSLFHGWQYQKNAVSVQEELQSAWQKLTGESLNFRGCSRTDTGVSARAHVCDFKTKSKIPEEKIPLALNTKLPPGLSALRCRPAPPDFHSRFSPIGKLYAYRFWTATSRPALARQHLAHSPGYFNCERANAFAPSLCGEHDFSAFMDQGSVVRKTIRRLDRLTFIQRGELVTMLCLGDGFLYHQVRILAGTFLALAHDQLGEAEILEAMSRGDRTRLGATAPAEGLCLERVFFKNPLFSEDGEEDYQGFRSANAESILPLLYLV